MVADVTARSPSLLEGLIVFGVQALVTLLRDHVVSLCHPNDEFLLGIDATDGETARRHTEEACPPTASGSGGRTACRGRAGRSC